MSEGGVQASWEVLGELKHISANLKQWHRGVNDNYIWLGFGSYIGNFPHLYVIHMPLLNASGRPWNVSFKIDVFVPLRLPKRLRAWDDSFVSLSSGLYRLFATFLYLPVYLAAFTQNLIGRLELQAHASSTFSLERSGSG